MMMMMMITSQVTTQHQYARRSASLTCTGWLKQYDMLGLLATK